MSVGAASDVISDPEVLEDDGSVSSSVFDDISGLIGAIGDTYSNVYRTTHAPTIPQQRTGVTVANGAITFDKNTLLVLALVGGLAALAFGGYFRRAS